MHTSQKLDVHGLSIRGDQHDKNHDHFAIATLNKSLRLHQSNLSIDDESRVHGHNQGHLFLVADAIDGAAPARASGAAVDSVVQYFLNEMPWYHLAEGAPDDVTLALEDALRNAQEELRRKGPRGVTGLGTTMTLAFVFWPHLYVAHVGDSRCYLGRGDELRQLTTDRRPTAPGLQPEVRHVLLRPGDKLALVTDGVAAEQSPHELWDVLRRSAPAEELCGRLVDGDGSDDRTAIVVRFLPLESVSSEVRPAPTPPHLSARRDERCETLRRSRPVASELRHANDPGDPRRKPAPATPPPAPERPERREPPSKPPKPLRLPGTSPEITPPDAPPKPRRGDPSARECA